MRGRNTQDLSGKGREISGKSLMGCVMSLHGLSVRDGGRVRRQCAHVYMSLRRLGVAVR